VANYRLRIGQSLSYSLTAEAGSYVLAGQVLSLFYPIAGDIPNPNSLPAGSLSFTVTWDQDVNASGYVVYVTTSTQAFPNASLYEYRYLVNNGSTTSLVISNVTAGTKYVRIASTAAGYVSDLSLEQTYTPA